MPTVATVLVALLALLHLYILVVEMFLWDTPYGRRAFALSPEQAKQTLLMAKNQGLYNGFLAAGLLWGLLAAPALEAFHVQIFFTACVAVAGIYGGITASKKILYFQGVPGMVALAAVLAAGA